MGDMGETVVGIGTRKGLWLARSEDRRTWRVEGPHFLMSEVLSLLFDTRTRPAEAARGVPLLALGSVAAALRRPRRHLGRAPRGSIRFPDDTDTALKATWQLVADPHDPAGGLGRHRAAGAVAQRGRRRDVRAQPRAVGAPAPPRVGRGLRRRRDPHRPAQPGRRRPHARRDEHRRRLQHPRRRRVVEPGQHRHPRLLPAPRRVARVRPVRPQGGPRQRAPRPGSTPRTTGASTAPTTTGSPGPRSRRGCRPTSA